MNFTENAKIKLYHLISSSDKEEICLRIYIVGGGCSGFQYGFTLENFVRSEEDLTFNVEKNGKVIQIVVDHLSYQYLEGASVDYLESLQGSRFLVNNPHAETTCGCGSSFSLKESS